MQQVIFKSSALNAVLARELALGNRVVEDGSWGERRLVMLASPFCSPANETPAALTRRDVNDPHYWKAELEDAATRELLACKF